MAFYVVMTYLMRLLDGTNIWMYCHLEILELEDVSKLIKHYLNLLELHVGHIHI